MKNTVHCWSYLARFSLEWEIFKPEVEKSKTHILRSVTFFPENFVVWDNVEKKILEPDRSQIIWRMRIACWITVFCVILFLV